MIEDESIVIWDSRDIKMAIKRYFYKIARDDFGAAFEEIEFLRSIHREWSFNPLMRRTDVDGMAVIDDFLKWHSSTPIEYQHLGHFTIRRLLK